MVKKFCSYCGGREDDDDCLDCSWVRCKECFRKHGKEQIIENKEKLERCLCSSCAKEISEKEYLCPNCWEERTGKKFIDNQDE